MACFVQNLYVLQRSWESGGRLFDAFFQQVILCLFLMVLFVGAQQLRSDLSIDVTPPRFTP